jgi:hypothetical protein
MLGHACRIGQPPHARRNASKRFIERDGNARLQAEAMGGLKVIRCHVFRRSDWPQPVPSVAVVTAADRSAASALWSIRICESVVTSSSRVGMVFPVLAL